MSAVRALREQGFDGRLTVVGAEVHLPYDRPPLSKAFLAGNADQGEHAPYTALPYFWSEQYGRQLQFAGSREPGDVVTVVEGSTQERRFVATYERAGRLVAVLGLDAPGPFSRLRRTLRGQHAAMAS